MSERYITLVLKGENSEVLEQAAQALATKIDEAMGDQKLLDGVEYDGIEVIDPDAPDPVEGDQG